VVFGWSSAIRFRLITKDDEWLPLIPLHSNCIERFNDISQQTIDEIHVNRMSGKCVEEMNNWINLINLQKHISVHWTPFQYPNEYKPIPIKIFGPETVTLATNGKINDGHFSEKGHQELAEQIYNLYRKEVRRRLSPSKSNRSLI
jgi:lysophospholipase L1-like esterase